MSRKQLGHWVVLALCTVILLLVFGFQRGATPASAQAALVLDQVNSASGSPGDILVLSFRLVNNGTSPLNINIGTSNLPAGVLTTNPGILTISPGTSMTFALNFSLPQTIGAGTYTSLVEASYSGGVVSTFGRFTVVGGAAGCVNLPLIRK